MLIRSVRMGIFIHIGISKAVQKKEWERIYEETLQLAKKFPLADMREVECRGNDVFCLTPTKEREYRYGWNEEKTTMCWCAFGDYETMHTAEGFFLLRDMVQEDYESDAGDALLGVLPAYLSYDWDDSRCNHIYRVWGAKTQGEPYHIYLLAIACLIESRLGDKAFVYGDITKAQCERAVELANMHLSELITLPARCDMERLWKRVSKLPLNEKEKLEAFEGFFLGNKNSEFGEYIRNTCSEEICEEYWKDKFKKVAIHTLGFDDEIKKYLLWGFGLEKLCNLVKYNDKDGASQYEEFVKKILDTKLHWKEKNCEDILEINQEEEQPYSIYTLLAQFAFAGARNKKVDRYIPIEEIRRVLKKEMAEKCNVDMIIDEYLETEAEYEPDESEKFSTVMNVKRQALIENREKYAISDYEEFIYYEQGDSIHPKLMEALKESFAFYNNLTAEDCYKKLMEKTAIERCKWLIQQNEYFFIRDKDWDKICLDIEKNKDAFARYYPMGRVKITDNAQSYLVIAIVLNDELYEFCRNI